MASIQQDAPTRLDPLAGHVRVLIVDDDRDWCEATQLLLEMDGIIAHAVHSGDAALEKLTRERYDAAIVDVQMPDRWGVDIVRELRETHGMGMPIIIATGASAATGVCAGLIAGADDEFFKGEVSESISEKLRSLWRERAH